MVKYHAFYTAEITELYVNGEPFQGVDANHGEVVFQGFLKRHSDVVIENCASGGQRMDYAMLSRLSIQSTSDQTHYERDEEEAVFNMVNAMLGRVHQSGFLNQLPKANFERVKEGIACYKSIRQEIKTALPRFQLGIIGFDAPWAAAALDCGTHWYLSVWRKDGQNETQEIPLAVPEAGRRIRAQRTMTAMI